MKHIISVIVDKKRGFYGFLKHVDKFPYHETVKYFTLTQNTSYEENLLEDINAWYDQFLRMQKNILINDNFLSL